MPNQLKTTLLSFQDCPAGYLPSSEAQEEEIRLLLEVLAASEQDIAAGRLRPFADAVAQIKRAAGSIP
jgi:hypothetical protein